VTLVFIMDQQTITISTRELRAGAGRGLTLFDESSFDAVKFTNQIYPDGACRRAVAPRVNPGF
jgi:hypothetical protein